MPLKVRHRIYKYVTNLVFPDGVVVLVPPFRRVSGGVAFFSAHTEQTKYGDMLVAS